LDLVLGLCCELTGTIEGLDLGSYGSLGGISSWDDFALVRNN